MRRVVAVSVDQLYRGQPGGIGTYVRGLLAGLAGLEDPDLDLVAMAPRDGVLSDPPPALTGGSWRVARAPAPRAVLTRLWARWPLGVPGEAAVVHATSLAGPFAGGARGARHSVALHDLLWRDAPEASTAAGVRFHEARLRRVLGRDDLTILTSSPGLAERLADEGVARERLHRVRLGVDDAPSAASREEVRDALAEHGVRGPFTLYAGTREPRKNLARLVAAHHAARSLAPDLGPLVVVGPAGWGAVETADAVVVGLVARRLLAGLYRDAAVLAYVPLAEGWGLPPVEALHAGTRVVASTTTPSVAGNAEVEVVDPLDVNAIAQGLVAALARGDDDPARARRRVSVGELTWRNCALDHLAGWA